MTTESQAAFARRLGVTPGYVSQLKAAGRLVLDESGAVRVEESLARIEETGGTRPEVADRHAQSRSEPAPPAPEDKVGNSYQAARAVKEKYLALTAKQEYEKSAGKLVEAAAVSAAASSAGAAFRARLESWPATLAAELVGKTDETQVSAILSGAVHELLDNLVRDFHKLGGIPPKTTELLT